LVSAMSGPVNLLIVTTIPSHPSRLGATKMRAALLPIGAAASARQPAMSVTDVTRRHPAAKSATSPRPAYKAWDESRVNFNAKLLQGETDVRLIQVLLGMATYCPRTAS
jgi:hypothetical protein